jgi:3-isopropylmalate/(R)-2-methylmalate dehydratase small subunit
MSELERIERRSGRGIVVRGNDIDTDQIIPGRFLRSISFVGLEEHVFADVRRTPDGVLKGHPFDQEHFEGASILVVNHNFGCGSSREHAPQALMRWGIRAIVGESFAEIFFGNCIALGIPAVTGSPGEIAALMDMIELDPSHQISLDLESLTVTSRAGTIRIQIPDGARSQLMDGTWDAMRTLLVAQDEIDDVAARLPYIRGF